MTGFSPLSITPALAAYALWGAVAGTVHFAALNAQVDAMMQRKGWIGMLLPIPRFALTAGMLLFAAFHGASALLAASMGVLVARALLLRVMASLS